MDTTKSSGKVQIWNGFNPVNLDSVDPWGQGIQEEWVNEDVWYSASDRFTVV